MVYYDEIVMLRLGLGRWQQEASLCENTRRFQEQRRRNRRKLCIFCRKNREGARRGAGDVKRRACEAS